MKTIKAYEIIHHGVEYPQYFQGCGVSGTEYTDVATGIGDSEHEALDDALGQLASNGWDIESDVYLLVNVQRASMGNLVTLFVDATHDNEYGYPWVHVSVRVR